MKTIAFLGAKKIGYRCLQYLLENKTVLNAKVIALASNEQTVLQNNEHCLLQLANEYQITVLPNLKDLPNCDFIVSVQYHKILKQRHIDKAKVLAVNLHMAPLPEYRGCNQFSFAIVDGAKVFGTTLHQLEAGIDDGAILFERRFPIEPNWFVSDLYEHTVKESFVLFRNHIAELIAGRYTPVPQQNLLAERGTSYHYRHEINNLKVINLDWSKEKIERHIRATYFPPYEPPYAYVNQKKMYFLHKWETKNS